MTSIAWTTHGGGEGVRKWTGSFNGPACPPSCWERQCVRGKINAGLWGRDLLLSWRSHASENSLQSDSAPKSVPACPYWQKYYQPAARDESDLNNHL